MGSWRVPEANKTTLTSPHPHFLLLPIPHPDLFDCSTFIRKVFWSGAWQPSSAPLGGKLLEMKAVID